MVGEHGFAIGLHQSEAAQNVRIHIEPALLQTSELHREMDVPAPQSEREPDGGGGANPIIRGLTPPARQAVRT